LHRRIHFLCGGGGWEKGNGIGEMFRGMGRKMKGRCGWRGRIGRDG
jgi:hypothetical protein